MPLTGKAKTDYQRDYMRGRATDQDCARGRAVMVRSL